MQSSSGAATIAANLWCPRHIIVTVEGRDGTRAEVPVDKPFARVGRDRRAEVSLSDASVLPCHLYLHATQDGIYCAGLAAAAPSGWLLPNATLEVGGFQIRAAVAGAQPALSVPADPQDKDSGSPPLPHIRVFWDENQTGFTDVTLHRQLTLVGRQSPATWRVKHPTISRAHCAFVWDGRQLWLIDFFSSNGTRLGSKKFDSGVVPFGQEFRLGMVRFRFLGNELPPSEASPESASAQPGIAMADIADSARIGWQATVDQGQGRGQAVNRRIDAGQSSEAKFAQGDAAPLSGPHLPGPVAAATFASADTPTVQPGAAQEAISPMAALIETSVPSSVDTKFVHLPQRQQERARGGDDTDGDSSTSLRELQREMAEAQKQFGSKLISRLELESKALRQEWLDQHVSLKQEAERLWEQRFAELADKTGRDTAEVERRSADLARQLTERLQPDAEKLAALEAELKRERQERLDQHVSLKQEAERLWEQRFAELADKTGRDTAEVERRSADLGRQLTERLQSDAEKLAALEAELKRERQERLDQHVSLKQEAERLWEQRLAELADKTGRDTAEFERRGRLDRQAQAEQLADLREKLLREVANLREQTELLRQELHSRLWEDRFAELAGQLARQAADLERRIALGLQSDADKLAALEGSLTAKIADLRARQERLREEKNTSQKECLETLNIESTPSEPRGPTASVATEAISPSTDRRVSSSDPSAAMGWLAPTAPGELADQSPPAAGQPETAAAPEWLMDDEFTHRLLDFQAKRERTVWRRRLLWAAAAVALTAAIAVAAALARSWLGSKESEAPGPAASVTRADGNRA